MYGLSSYFDVSKFLKKELILISFTTNTINLLFEKETEGEENIFITIMNAFNYQDSKDNIIEQNIPVSFSNLMCLLGKVVQFAERDTNGGLILRFDNDDILTILDNSKYESYSIQFGNADRIFV